MCVCIHIHIYVDNFLNSLIYIFDENLYIANEDGCSLKCTNEFAQQTKDQWDWER